LSTQRFDGRDLDAALARARAKVGAGARVVSAERIRSGGLGGFFARERVEIEVELADEAWPPPSSEDAPMPPDDEPTPPGAAASLLDLVDIVSDADRFEPAAFVQPDRVDVLSELAQARSTSRTGRGRHAIKDSVPPPPPPRRPTVSTESASFAEVLQRIAGEADLSAETDLPAEADRFGEADRAGGRSPAAAGSTDAGTATSSVGGRPDAPRAPLAVAPLGVAVAPAETSDGIEVSGRPTLLMPAIGDPGMAEHGRAIADAGMAEHGRARPIAGLVPARRRSTERAITPTVQATALELAPLRPARRPIGAHFRPASETALIASDADPLSRLGLPDELLPVADGRDLRARLVHQLAELPAPPPLPATRGTVVAIVGSRGPAHDVALAVCATVGSNPDSIATIAPRTRTPKATELGTPEEAAEQRRAWRRRQTPTVAVIEAPLGQSSAWAGEMLEALEPTVVWGLVDACRKVEDITAWSDDLGGLDALCLNGLDDTVSPASALQTGVPVVLLEGQAATPERWADVLIGRLAS
jgi:hypothetical protein